jgi:hypothetical protein
MFLVFERSASQVFPISCYENEHITFVDNRLYVGVDADRGI